MTPRTAVDWPALLRSKQILLRKARHDDPSPDWLSEAESAVPGAGEPCPLSQRRADGDAVYWLRPPGTPPDQPLGACAARIDGRELCWTWLAVDEAWRAYGFGGAAVPVIERAAARQGIASGRVLVPARNGIALYFWLRLGYRPITDPPWEQPYPGTWMRRDISPRGR